MSRFDSLHSTESLMNIETCSISKHAMFNDLSFNKTFTNDIVSFEQLGPEKYLSGYPSYPQIRLRYPNICGNHGSWFGKAN